MINKCSNIKLLQQWYCFKTYCVVGLFFLCTFVVTKSLGEIQKLYFFNDKELPAMGSKSERLVLQFLELLVNPTAVTPRTNTFSMTKKNQFVTGIAVCNNVTPMPKLKQATSFQFFTEYFKQLPFYKTCEEAFLVVNIKHYELYGAFRFLSYQSFKKQTA